MNIDPVNIDPIKSFDIFYEELKNAEKSISEPVKMQIQLVMLENLDLSNKITIDDLNNFSSKIFEIVETLKGDDLTEEESSTEEPDELSDKEELSDTLSKVMAIGVQAIESEMSFDQEAADTSKNDLPEENKKSEKQNMDETSIYKFLLCMNPKYVPAWVKLAKSYQDMGLNDVAEHVYAGALNFIDDNLLRVYAAEFYIMIGRVEKAKELLTDVRKGLVQENKDDRQNPLYDKVSKLLFFID